MVLNPLCLLPFHQLCRYSALELDAAACGVGGAAADVRAAVAKDSVATAAAVRFP